MNCKHCGKEIIKCVDRWYHKQGSKWLCNTKHAEPNTNNSNKEKKQ